MRSSLHVAEPHQLRTGGLVGNAALTRGHAPQLQLLRPLSIPSTSLHLHPFDFFSRDAPGVLAGWSALATVVGGQPLWSSLAVFLAVPSSPIRAAARSDETRPAR